MAVKDPETGLWKTGDKVDGIELGRSHWWEFIIAIFVLVAIVVVLFLDDRAPQREVWGGWRVFGIIGLTLLGLVLTGFSIWILHLCVVSALGRYHGYKVQCIQDAIETERRRRRNGTDHLAEQLNAARINADGALVRFINGGWQVVNLSSETGPIVMSDDGRVHRAIDDDLSRAQIAASFGVRLEEAKSHSNPMLHTLNYRTENSAPVSAEVAESNIIWPERVLLRDIAPQPTTLSNLVLGVTMSDGRQQTVAAPLSTMVHIAVGGSSGWGKSVFLRALTYQLATAAEQCRLALIDLEAMTLAPFGKSNRLLYPVADTENDAIAIARELFSEMERRKELYLSYSGVDNLSAYNAKAEEPLLPIICVIDEATVLLGHRDVHSVTRQLTLRARKYGIWMVLGGQAWRSTDIDGAIRDMLAARVHFKAMAAGQSRVLLNDPCAANINVIGRAFALLPSRPLLEIQAPFIDPSEIDAAMNGQTGPLNEATWRDEEEDRKQQEIGRIRSLAAEGKSRRAIEKEVFGYNGGEAYHKVRAALEDE